MKETVHNCIKRIFAKMAPIQSMKWKLKETLVEHAPLSKATSKIDNKGRHPRNLECLPSSNERDTSE